MRDYTCPLAPAVVTAVISLSIDVSMQSGRAWADVYRILKMRVCKRNCNAMQCVRFVDVKIHVAAVQCSPVFLNLPATLDTMDHWVRRAAAGGAVIIAFPETWLPGYPSWLDSSPEAGIWAHDGAKDVFARLFNNSVEVPSRETARIGALAAELSVT